MTNDDSIEKLTVKHEDLKRIESFSTMLIAMSESYNLPEPVSLVISDLADMSESIRMSALVHESIKPALIEASS